MNRLLFSVNSNLKSKISNISFTSAEFIADATIPANAKKSIQNFQGQVPEGYTFLCNIAFNSGNSSVVILGVGVGSQYYPDRIDVWNLASETVTTTAKLIKLYYKLI